MRTLIEQAAEALNISDAELQSRFIATPHVLAYTVSLIEETPKGRRSTPLLSCISQKTGYAHKDIRNLCLTNTQLEQIEETAQRYGAALSVRDEFSCRVYRFDQFRKQ